MRHRDVVREHLVALAENELPSEVRVWIEAHLAEYRACAGGVKLLRETLLRVRFLHQREVPQEFWDDFEATGARRSTRIMHLRSRIQR